MTLRSLLSLPRMLRHGSTIGTDLPPDTAVVLDPPAPRLRTALVAAALGRYLPVSHLLAATRKDGEWENRGAWVPRLATAALHNPGWLDDWLAAAPDDPDAALLRAGVSLKHAWAVRTGARAKDVPQEQFQAFFALLDDAVPVISAAAEANPADPVPWQLALEHATGSQSPRDVFDAYWAQAVERAPHHYGCHVAAMQYLCEKWHGSHEEMFDFAERAAEHALPGSKLHALPLLAAVEYDVLAEAVGGDDARRSRISRVRVRAAVERALALVESYEPGDPEVADVRNHLALMLLLARRPGESLAQFSAIGTHATEYPWGYFGPPREQFLEFRAGVRLHVASQIPFFAGRAIPAQRVQQPDAVTVAVLRAAPRRVAEAARQAGADLRIAPRGDATYAEVPAGTPERGASARRATLMGEDGLTAVAASLTRAVRRPALVLRRTGDRYGFTLLHRGRRLADHEWDPAAPIPDHETAAATARTLAASYGVADARPLTALLRASDAPAVRLTSLVAALGLPPVPPDLTLTKLPDTQLISRAPRPRGWWAVRVAAMLVCAPATAYAWWAPGIGRTRASLATVATAYLTARLTRAWRHRPRHLPGA
ncbi:hypothetical protein [Streptomyces sp. 8L]|uniref:hypothetical protein n=1 Tax=Streptomyces sp. 8L TaxID=2877242 RepID=UPI001CD7F1C3|nr:hypothetical protein [Streptomyces sp. 8L]MCA1221355.1 hypothetical protein [Streptomyces sp. 8L]